MTASPDITRALAQLRKALEARMRDDDRRERADSRKRKADGELVSYDTRALAKLLRPALEWDGRGWRAIAAEIGVTSPDLSRVMSGQDISAGKVFAICDWLRVDPRRFYRPLKGDRPCFKGRPRRATSRPAAAVFHGKSTETDGGPSAAGRKPDRALGLMARPARSEAEGDSVRVKP